MDEEEDPSGKQTSGSRWVEIIAEYGAVFKNRRRTCNQIADELSRNPVEREDKGNDGGLLACAITHKIPGEEDIRIRQWTDEELRPIIHQLVATEVTEKGEQPTELYAVKNGVLYKKRERGILREIFPNEGFEVTEREATDRPSQPNVYATFPRRLKRS